MSSRTMTIDERARKILDKIYDFEMDDGEFLIPWIAAELRAVREEAQNTTHCKTHCGCFAHDQAYAKGLDEGISKGLLRAAEIAKNHLAHEEPECSDPYCIAERLRKAAGCE